MRKRISVVMLMVFIVCTVFISNVLPVFADCDSYIGEVQLFPYGYAPLGWIECNGQVLNVQQNNTLFSLIGSRFGGDGTTTFALPDMRGMEPTKDVRYYIATTGIYPEHDGSGNEDYTGEIKLFPYNFDPSGYMHCDGRILSVSEYSILFALIGATYGGDGVNTFALPDMRSMEPNEYCRYCINPYGVFPTRD